MGLRFRRTIRIAPGVRINVGKKGASVYVGPRGMKTTVGANGVRQTVGLPGSGLSYTTYSPWSRGGAASGGPRATAPIAAQAAAEPSALGSWFRSLFDPTEKARVLLRAALRDPDPASAAASVGQALAIDSSSLETLILYAKYLEGVGDRTTVFGVYGSIAPRKPSDERLALNYVAAGLNAGRCSDLVAFANTRLPSVDTESAPGQIMLALISEIFLGVGDPSAALAVIGRAPLRKRVLDGPLLMCLLVRAESNIAAGQKAKARKDLDRLKAFDPAFPGLSAVEGKL